MRFTLLKRRPRRLIFTIRLLVILLLLNELWFNPLSPRHVMELYAAAHRLCEIARERGEWNILGIDEKHLRYSEIYLSYWSRWAVPPKPQLVQRANKSPGWSAPLVETVAYDIQGTFRVPKPTGQCFSHFEFARYHPFEYLSFYPHEYHQIWITAFYYTGDPIYVYSVDFTFGNQKYLWKYTGSFPRW